MDARGSGHKYTEGSVTGSAGSTCSSSCRLLKIISSSSGSSEPGRGDKLLPSDAAAATARRTGFTPDDEPEDRCG